MDGNTQPTERDQLPAPVQPGAMIAPSAPGDNSPTESPAAPLPPSPPVEPEAPAAPAPELPVPSVTAPQPPVSEPVPQPVSAPDPALTTGADSGFYHSEGEAPLPPAEPPTPGDASSVSWTASEFIAHHKTFGWYALLAVFAAVAAAAIWLVTKDTFAAVVIVLAVAMLAGYAARQPRELQYAVNAHGITVGQRQYPYDSFRSFSVFEDGAFSSIELMPLKRFSPPISMYYDPKDERAITDALAARLPFEPRQRDALDKLMHKIRF